MPRYLLIKTSLMRIIVFVYAFLCNLMYVHLRFPASRWSRDNGNNGILLELPHDLIRFYRNPGEQ